MTAPGPFLMRSVLLAAARFVIAAAIFGVAELFAGQVLGSGRMPLALVLIATGLVAGVFWSTRAGLEHLVDRLLFGERAAGFEAGRALLQRMATTLPVDDILPGAGRNGRAHHAFRAGRGPGTALRRPAVVAGVAGAGGGRRLAAADGRRPARRYRGR